MIRRLIGLSLLGGVLIFAVVAIAVSPIFGRGTDSSALGLTLGLDLKGGAHLLYRIVPPAGGTISDADANLIRDIVAQRVNEFGVNEPNVQLLGDSSDYRILAQIPGAYDRQTVTIYLPDDLLRHTADGLETVTTDEFNSFVATTLAGSQFTLEDNPTARAVGDRQFTLTFQNLRSEVKNAAGEVVIKADADTLRDALGADYPIQLDLLYRYVSPSADTLVAASSSADTTVTDPLQALPTADDIRTILGTAGRPDVQVVPFELDSPYAHDFESRTGDFLISKSDRLFHLEIASPSTTLVVLTGTTQQLPQDVADIILGVASAPFYWNGRLGSQISSYSVDGGIEQAKQLIGSTAQLEFLWRQCGPAARPPADLDSALVDQWSTLRCQDPQYYTEVSAGINPSDLINAQASLQDNSQWVVNIGFNSEGADAFFRATSNVASNGDLLAIYLDGRQLIAPSASTGISGGRAFISGNFSGEEARLISVQLRSGALPAELELIQERLVDSTLGDDALTRSLIAAAVGFALLVLFLIAYYKVPGLMAVTTLAMYTLVLVAIIKLIPITLTLSGAAAIILSFGFAVDANILIAERIKEELRTGRDLLAAINNGFKRAWPSIRDGNLSTLIIAIVLYWFGDRLGISIVQGFALTLGVGIGLSMFFAYTVNRFLVRIVAANLIVKPSWYSPVPDPHVTTSRKSPPHSVRHGVTEKPSKSDSRDGAPDA